MRNRLGKCSLETVPEETIENDEIEDSRPKEHIKPRISIVSLRNDISCVQDIPTTPMEVGTFGTINIEHSQDVHFGHKIFTSPLTIVNKLGDDDEHAIQGSFADVITKSTDFFKSRYYLRYRHVTARQRATCAICGVCFVTAVATCIVILVILNKWNTFTESPELIPNVTWFVQRSEWQAIAPFRRHFLELPVMFLIIAHTAMTPCNTTLECMETVQRIQEEHMIERRWDDIGYNYLIGIDGLTFQGRGSNTIGTHTEGYNSRSIAFAFMGNFNIDVPNDLQLDSLKFMIDELIKYGKLHYAYYLVAACKINGMESPGSNLIKILEQWPNWINNINDIYQ